MLDEKKRLELEEEERRLTAAAYHEAGHTVMFIAVEPNRDAFRHVELTPDDEDLIGHLFHVSLKHMYADWRDDAATAFRIFSYDFCTVLAGPLAELKHGEISGPDGVPNLEDYLMESDGQRGSDGDKAFLYDAGLTTITGKKANPWNNLELLTRQFLESHWGHVDRVAKALLEKGMLDYDATVAAMGGLPTLPKNNWIDRQCKRINISAYITWPNLCRLIAPGADGCRSMHP